MATRVNVTKDAMMCVGKHGGIHIHEGVKEYHDDIAAAIVVAGYGSIVVEEKQHFTPENKMMPEAPENKAEKTQVESEQDKPVEEEADQPDAALSEQDTDVIEPVKAQKRTHQYHRRG